MKRIREIENQWNAPLEVKILGKKLKKQKRKNIYIEYLIFFWVERECLTDPEKDQLGE